MVSRAALSLFRNLQITGGYCCWGGISVNGVEYQGA